MVHIKPPNSRGYTVHPHMCAGKNHIQNAAEICVKTPVVIGPRNQENSESHKLD